MTVGNQTHIGIPDSSPIRVGDARLKNPEKWGCAADNTSVVRGTVVNLPRSESCQLSEGIARIRVWQSGRMEGWKGWERLLIV